MSDLLKMLMSFMSLAAKFRSAPFLCVKERGVV